MAYGSNKMGERTKGFLPSTIYLSTSLKRQKVRIECMVTDN